MGFQFRSSLAGLFALTAQAALELAAAQDAQLPRLYTNEIAIEDATRRTALGIDDPVAVFAFIFGALPDRVRVYPTENYLYFSFFHNGTSRAALAPAPQFVNSRRWRFRLPIRDFAPVVVFGIQPNVLVAAPSTGFKTVS